MPDTLMLSPDAVPEESRDALRWALDEFRSERQREYFKFYQYIDGDQPLKFATEKFRTAFGASLSEFTYNRTGAIVDAVTDRLQVAGFGGDDDGEEAQHAHDLWDDNDMALREAQVYDESATAGDAYVIVEKHPETGDAQIWPQSAVQCRVRYSQEEPGKTTMGARQWIDDAGHPRVNLYFRDRIEKYRAESAQKDIRDISDIAREVDGASLAGTFAPFQPEGDTAWPIPIEGDTVPVFHFPNRGTVNSYGRSELKPVIPLQDALNKNIMDLLVAMEFAAFPQRYLLNADDTGTEESIKRYMAGIDRLLNIRPEDPANPAGAGEFSAAEVDQYIDPIDLMDRLISRVSKVPEHYLRLEADFPSGRALRLAEAPFVAKLEKMQRAFGSVWLRVLIYALGLAGTQADRKSLRVNWRSAAPLGKEDLLDVAQMEKNLGLALTTILRETLGLDKDQIDKYLEEIQEEQDKQAERFNAGLMPGAPGAFRPLASLVGREKDENQQERNAERQRDRTDKSRAKPAPEKRAA